VAKEVKVVFVKDLKGNAKLGQMKNVKLGFARNYLVPQGYALTVTKENLSLTSGLIKREEHRKINEKKAAEELGKALDNKTLSTSQTAHDGGKLYGSVGVGDIQSLIRIDLDLEVDKKYIQLKSPIKETGEFKVPVILPEDITCTITIKVSAKD